MLGLKPFWCYYGGKWKAAPRYPSPEYSSIVEPFAGAAGYSLRYYDRDIYLVDAYPVVAGIWSYLIKVSPEEIQSIPYVEHINDLPGWVPQEARWLVGFSLNDVTTHPCNVLSSGKKKKRYILGRLNEGWSSSLKDRIASQVTKIRHWKILKGDYRESPDIESTWFIDPPYNNKAGSYYTHKFNDYENLSKWCKERNGQVIVCENVGADWLPFEWFGNLQSKKGCSKEVIWHRSGKK